MHISTNEMCELGAGRYGLVFSSSLSSLSSPFSLSSLSSPFSLSPLLPFPPFLPFLHQYSRLSDVQISIFRGMKFGEMEIGADLWRVMFKEGKGG